MTRSRFQNVLSLATKSTAASAIISASIAAVPSSLAVSDLVREGANILALLLLLLGILASAALPWVTRRWLRQPRAARRRWGFTGALVVSAVYVASVALIAWLRPTNTSGWVWVALIVHMTLFLSACALMIRFDDAAVERARHPAHLAFFACVFGCGVALMGLAAAVVAEALRAIWNGHAVTGVSIFVEAAALSATGLALLVARRVVASLALFGLGIALVGYGLASLASNDTLYGSSVIALAVTISVLGLAIWREADPGSAIGYFLAGGATVFLGIASALENRIVAGVGACVLALILFTMSGLALRVRDTSDLFRHPNELRPWTSRRYLGVATAIGAVAISAAIWTGWTQGTHQGAVVYTAASTALAAGAINVALVVSLTKRSSLSHAAADVGAVETSPEMSLTSAG
ncbi:MAG: hypothetical protein H7288_20560 [Kineosporiaceae bacterium]|nr:hypothetical protein [Aeromicrobium sp.]